METLSKKIRDCRIKNNLTQSEVAKRIGVSSSTYRDWEYGRKIPAIYLGSIAEILSVSLEELIGKTANPKTDFKQAIHLIEKGLLLLKKM